MPLAVRVVRRLSTCSFGLQSAGSLWCDRVAVGRALRRAGLEVINSERHEPCLSKVHCNWCAATHVAERCPWHASVGALDAQQHVTRRPFQVRAKRTSPSTRIFGFTLALSWMSSVSVLQASECEASSVSGDLSSIVCAVKSRAVSLQACAMNCVRHAAHVTSQGESHHRALVLVREHNR